MGLLDGGIEALFGTVFGSLYLPGTLTRVELLENDKGGGTSSPSSQGCRLQVDACTEVMRAQPGYTSKDVRLLVLQSGITGGPVDSDCEVTPLSGRYADVTFLVQWVTEDPASSYWECRATPA